MTVKAKFFVAQTTRYAHNPEQTEVVLRPVTRGEENKEWAKYTPSGEIRLSIMQGGAAGFFAERLGCEIDITFTEADDPAPAAG